MIPIHKGPYRGKGEDGQPDNRILYVTAVCPKDDVVTYAEFTDSCTLGGILRMGVGKSSEDVYKRVTFAEFADLVAHELEWQRLTWRRKPGLAIPPPDRCRPYDSWECGDFTCPSFDVHHDGNLCRFIQSAPWQIDLGDESGVRSVCWPYIRHLRDELPAVQANRPVEKGGQ
jgi:hypothetical protein